jgi:hypothetical protein
LDNNQRLIIKEGRLRSALRYLVGGCIFGAAGLIHTYKNELIAGAKILFRCSNRSS